MKEDFDKEKERQRQKEEDVSNKYFYMIFNASKFIVLILSQ